MANTGILGSELSRFNQMGLNLANGSNWGTFALAAAEAKKRGGVALPVSNNIGQKMFYIVAVSDWAAKWNGGAGNPVGTSEGAGPTADPGTPAGLTNPGSQLSGSSVASAGGADIPRGATGPQGVGTDIRSEFLGISTAPDTMLGGQHATYAENVDGTFARGALTKRPGYVPVNPNRYTEFDDGAEPTPNVLLPVITAGHKGRSINVLPAGVRHTGRAILVLGYDDSLDLGEGTSAAGTTELRAVAVDINYNVQRDISRVKPLIDNDGASTPGDIGFVVEMPVPFRKDSGDDDGVRASVTQLVVVASKTGYILDRDNEDNKRRGRMVRNYAAWDGNNLTVLDEDLTPGDVWFYTIWAVNEFEVSQPAFYTETVEAPAP